MTDDDDTWRPGSNAAFGRNNGVPDLMRPSAANGVQGLMRPSAAKCQRKKIDNVVYFFSLALLALIIIFR